jgi:hypothetical protein
LTSCSLERFEGSKSSKQLKSLQFFSLFAFGNIDSARRVLPEVPGWFLVFRDHSLST